MGKPEEKLVGELLPLIGGAENVNTVFYCYTRLRFTLKDNSLVDDSGVASLIGVLATKWIGATYSIIIGDHVKDVFEVLAKYVNVKMEEPGAAPDGGEFGGKRKMRNPVMLFFATMSGVMQPILYAICGSGLVMGLHVLCVNAGILQPDSVFAMVLGILGNVGFYWLPMYVAMTAAEHFKANKILAIALVGILMHPTISNLAAGGTESLSLFGFVPMRLLDYSSTVIPSLILVYIQSKFEKLLYKVLPKMLRTVVVPLADIVILGCLALVLVGPVAKYVSDWISQGYLWLYNLASIPASILFAALYPFIVLGGLHMSLAPICFQSLATLGVDYIMPLMSICHTGMAAASLAVFFRTRDARLKGVSATAAIVTGIGLTEPALYGVFLPFKRVMVMVMVANGIGGLICGIFKTYAIALALSPLGGLPVYFNPTFKSWLLATLVTLCVSFFGTLLFAYRRGDENADKRDDEAENVQLPERGA